MTDTEINKAIAIAIFGARVEGEKIIGYEIPIQEDFPNGGYLHLDNPHEVPNYCNDISDAFTVVEKMKKDWLNADERETNFWRFTDCAEYGWTAAIIWGSDDGELGIASEGAESLSKAICLAALKVVEPFSGLFEKEATIF